ncbi:MAG: hypothetical protein RIC56_21060 [Pseudomonadales bacterium]
MARLPWRALGLALLIVSIGVASCQALFRLPDRGVGVANMGAALAMPAAAAATA